jgi:hypothetical protein
MKTLRHLASETGITPQDISASPWDNARNVFMSPEVIRFAEEQRFFRQAIDERTELIGAKDKSLRIPYSTAHQAITYRTTGEGSGVGEYGKERTYTEMSSLDTMDITPSYKLGGVGIDKELLGTTRVDLIKEAKFILVEDIEEGIESAITDAYDTNVTTNVVYGGDATTPATLATGDKFTLDLLADAIQKLGTKWKASLLYISSYQRAILHKSSQFTNAAEYGNNEVVLNGEIGKYLGIKVIETDLTKSYAGSAQDAGIAGDTGVWGADGTSCQLIGTTRSGRKPGILAWKEKPSVDYEYLKRKATHYLLSDVAYGVGIVHETACCLIKVTNA